MKMDKAPKNDLKAPFSDEPDVPMVDHSLPPDGGRDGKEEGLWSIMFGSLPTALSRVVIKSLLFALACFVAGVFFSVITWSTSPLLFLAIGCWFIWSGVSIVRDYRDGKIIERALVCTGVAYQYGGGYLGKKASKRIMVTFRDADERLHGHYQYIVPASNINDFSISAVYATYVRASVPQVLLAYIML